MTLTSSAFQNNGRIPIKYASWQGQASGVRENKSPPLQWNSVPGAVSYAVICEDLTTPWKHWMLFNMESNRNSLPEGVPQSYSGGGMGQGLNTFGGIGYGGPSPPPRDRAHQYVFRVYALHQRLPFRHGTRIEVVERAMAPAIIGQAQLTGWYDN